MELRQGYYVKLVVTGKEGEGEFHRIGSVEPFEYETGDSDTAEFASIVAGAESSFKTVDVLEPSERPPHLQRNLWGVRDGCKYYIKIPTGTSRLGVDKDKDVGFITNEKSPYFAPDPMYEFWLIHDYFPAINAVNVTPSAVTPKVYFRGEKYDIAPVTDKDKDILEKLKNYEKGISPSIPFTIITIGGVKT